MKLPKYSLVIIMILQKLRITRKIRHLSIENAGIEADVPFVKLKNGFQFYGIKSREKDKKYYFILPARIREQLPFYCFQTALNIVIRYFEGGLKLGGPRKEQFYKVKEGDIIAEMGAYMGYYTMYLSQKVGKAGKVIAIEPMMDNLSYLKKNIEKNNIHNVLIVDKGVWNEEGELTFYRKKGDHQSGSLVLVKDIKENFSIPVDSLNNILIINKIQHVDFMIIQLNGSEYEALLGLTNIKPEHLAIAARYDEHRKGTVRKIQVLLRERGYSISLKDKRFIFAFLLK